jgi:hypothetical protein
VTVKDVVWLKPDGGEVAEHEWNENHARALGLFLAGGELEEFGRYGYARAGRRFPAALQRAPRAGGVPRSAARRRNLACGDRHFARRRRQAVRAAARLSARPPLARGARASERCEMSSTHAMPFGAQVRADGATRFPDLGAFGQARRVELEAKGLARASR